MIIEAGHAFVWLAFFMRNRSVAQLVDPLGIQEAVTVETCNEVYSDRVSDRGHISTIEALLWSDEGASDHAELPILGNQAWKLRETGVSVRSGATRTLELIRVVERFEPRVRIRESTPLRLALPVKPLMMERRRRFPCLPSVSSSATGIHGCRRCDDTNSNSSTCECRLPFQPFAVQCLTCGSQLRVTDPSIVGTIGTCPKCSSMVQIDRPAGQVEVGRSSVDSQAITEEAIAADDGSSFEPNVDAQGFHGTDSIPDEMPSGAIPPDWQSDKTRRSKQVALVVAVSVSGLLLAVAVFGWFVRSWGKSDSTQEVAQVAAEGSTADSVDDVSSGTSNTQDADSNTPNIDGSGTPATNESNELAAIEGDETNDPASDATKSGEATDTPQESNAATSAAVEPPVTAANSNPQVPNDLIPEPVLDPLSSNPVDALNAAARAADAAASGEGNVAGNNEADASGMQDLPPELQKYTKFLLGDVAQKPPTLEAPPMMEDIKVDEAAAEQEDSAPVVPIKPKTLNLTSDLAIRLALASEGYPMSDLVLLVGQVTGVPIQVDWLSFDLAGTDVETLVPTKKAWLSARDILNDASKALNAELREEDSVVICTLRDDAFADAFERVASLDDFGAGKASAEKVRVEFMGKGEGDPRQLQQLEALATEALRRMRSIQPKMDDNRLHRWACLSTDTTADWTVLAGGDAGTQVDSPIAIAGFLRRMARLNQATCLFNWYDANRKGAAPERLVLPHAGPDAGTTLDNLLSPMGLQVRQPDANHWWVGTEATYDRLPIVVWTPPLGDSRDNFVRRIQGIMASSPNDVFRLTVDEESDRALLLLPRYIVRQLPTIAPSIAQK